MSVEFWFMFPAAIVIATIAMASGVEGVRCPAEFLWQPVSLLLPLPP